MKTLQKCKTNSLSNSRRPKHMMNMAPLKRKKGTCERKDLAVTVEPKHIISHCSIDSIPSWILLEKIFPLLNVPDLYSALLTCSYWSKASQSDTMWKKVCHRLWQTTPKNFTAMLNMPAQKFLKPKEKDWSWVCQSKQMIPKNISRFTGVGMMESPNSHYEGDWVDGEYSGLGTFWTLHIMYQGQFLKGAMTGRGLIMWPSGARYDGEWIEDKRTGKGTMYWPNGGRYTGDWVQNSRTGKGIYIWMDGDCQGDRYEGDFLDGEITGTGIYYWADGDRYEGEFSNSVMTGSGIYYWADGDRYEGERLDGDMTGKGIYYWANGEHFQGVFNEGSNCSGTMHWKNGDTFTIDENQHSSVYTWVGGIKYRSRIDVSSMKFLDSDLSGQVGQFQTRHFKKDSVSIKLVQWEGSQ